MTASTFMAVVITAVVSAVAGYLLKHFQDNRHIDELIRMFESTMSRMTAEWKAKEMQYQKLINIYQASASARQMATVQPIVMKKEEAPDWLKTFLDTSEPLPESGFIDIDFPSNGKEDK